ncbi:MAG TPA: TRAP transporter substrate-binding protein [Rhodothermales bacterium]
MTRSLALSILVLSISLAACAGERDVTVLKLGHGMDPGHPVARAMEYMAEVLAEKSGGQMRIDIYPAGQLGSERELLELLQIGSVPITKVSAAALEGFAPAYKMFSVPYLFRDKQHMFNVLEGEVGDEILLSGEKYWLRGLTYYDAGSRSFYTKARPINSPSDLAGLKIRVMESPSAVQMINQLGGSATPISYGELYSALQQGVVDGAENNPPSFHMSRHYEICKYYTLDEHTSIPDVLVISTAAWARLTPQEQAWLQEAADESAEKQKVLWKEAVDEALRVVQEAGVEIIRPPKEPFADKVEPLYAAYAPPRSGRWAPEDSLIYSLIQRVRETE